MKKGNLRLADRKAIYLKMAEAYSDIGAYLKTHPKASQATAEKNAYKYFKRIMAIYDTLPLPVQLKLCGLGRDRVFTEINKRLKSTNKVYFKGQKVAENPDNKVRQQATELLTRIHGLDRTTDAAVNTDDTDNEFNITDNNIEPTIQDIENGQQ